LVPAVIKIGSKIAKSPVTKKVLSTAKEAAIQTGVNVLADTLTGENVGDSLKSNVVKAKEKVGFALKDALTAERGSLKRQKRQKQAQQSPTPGKKRKRKTKRNHILD